MAIKALIVNGRVHDILDSGANPFPPFHPDLLWVPCDNTVQVGYVWNGTTFSAYVPTPAEVAAAAQVAADSAASDIAKADPVITYLVNHTPAECAAYVAANVTNLATAVNVLQKVAMALSVLARKELR